MTTGVGSGVVDKITGSGEGTATPPVYTGVGSSTLRKATCAGSATYTLGYFSLFWQAWLDAIAAQAENPSTINMNSWVP